MITERLFPFGAGVLIGSVAVFTAYALQGNASDEIITEQQDSIVAHRERLDSTNRELESVNLTLRILRDQYAQDSLRWAEVLVIEQSNADLEEASFRSALAEARRTASTNVQAVITELERSHDAVVEAMTAQVEALSRERELLLATRLTLEDRVAADSVKILSLEGISAAKDVIIEEQARQLGRRKIETWTTRVVGAGGWILAIAK